MQKLLTDIGKKSKKAINKSLSTKKKDKVLKDYRLLILKNKKLIINENKKDIKNAFEKGIKNNHCNEGLELGEPIHVYSVFQNKKYHYLHIILINETDIFPPRRRDDLH